MAEKRLYIVETISQHRVCFCVEAETPKHAMDRVTSDDFQKEFGQEWVGQQCIAAHSVTEDQYIEQFDILSDYLKNIEKNRKLEYIMLAAEPGVDQ